MITVATMVLVQSYYVIMGIGSNVRKKSFVGRPFPTIIKPL